MQEKNYIITNILHEGCSRVIEKPSLLFKITFLISILIMLFTQANNFIELESKVDDQNQVLRVEAFKIIEEKDLDITLSENLTKYEIEQNSDYYYVYLFGSELNYVKLILDEEFIPVKVATVSNMWLVVLLIFAFIYLITFFIFNIIISIIFIITEKITSLKHLDNIR